MRCGFAVFGGRDHGGTLIRGCLVSRILRGRDAAVLYLKSVVRATKGDPELPRPVTLEASLQQDGDADEHLVGWMSPTLIDATARRVLELGAGGMSSLPANESAC